MPNFDFTAKCDGEITTGRGEGEGSDGGFEGEVVYADATVDVG